MDCYGELARKMSQKQSELVIDYFEKAKIIIGGGYLKGCRRNYINK